MNERLTGCEELARLPKVPGASEGHDPSTVASMSTDFL